MGQDKPPLTTTHKRNINGGGNENSDKVSECTKQVVLKDGFRI
jgi:hypothetical protein